MLSISLDTKSVQRELAKLAERDIPSALYKAINDSGRAAITGLQSEMRSVFDRPAALTVNGLRLTKRASKDDLLAVVGFKDVFGKRGDVIENALTPHIPGYPNTRHAKGMERQLRRVGFLKRNEWLVPSSTCPLDKNGNVRGSLASKMLADIGAYRGISGFTGTTKSTKARYVFGTVRGRKGGLVKGIWLVQGGASKLRTGRWKLMMLAVDKTPTYRKRFDFYGIGKKLIEMELSRQVVRQVNYKLQKLR